MKSHGVGITAFYVCPTVGNRPTSERLMVEKNHSEADPVLFVKSCKVLGSFQTSCYCRAELN